WVAGAGGDAEQGITMLTDSIAELRRTGTSLALPGFYLLLVQLCLRAGREQEAARLVPMAAIETRGSAGWGAGIERMRGDILAANDANAAEAAYRQSLAIARRQHAVPFLCRTTLSLVRLLQSQGRGEESKALLRECVAQLQEGEDIAMVREVRSTI